MRHNALIEAAKADFPLRGPCGLSMAETQYAENQEKGSCLGAGGAEAIWERVLADNRTCDIIPGAKLGDQSALGLYRELGQ